MSERPRKRKAALAVLAILFVLLLIKPGVSRGEAPAPGPLDQVKATVEEIFQVLKDEKFAAPERQEEKAAEVMAVVRKRFDFIKMSQGVLTNFWKQLTPQEQEHFTGLFSEFLKKIYIRGLDSYSFADVTFEKEELKARRKGDSDIEAALVYTRVKRDTVESPLVYKLTKKSGQWMIYDVVIENVSQISKFRSEFVGVNNRKKYEELVRDLQEKISKRDEPGEVNGSK